MTCVIAETCIDVKDGVCTAVCPVDCICTEHRCTATEVGLAKRRSNPTSEIARYRGRRSENAFG